MREGKTTFDTTSMMADYPNPYLNTEYAQYQDPYSNTSTYDNTSTYNNTSTYSHNTSTYSHKTSNYDSYYDAADTETSPRSYSVDAYRDNSDDYDKRDIERYENSERYDDRYTSSYDNGHEDQERYDRDSQEDRDRQSRRNRSERRRHMRRDEGRRDDRREDRGREDRGRDRDWEDRSRDRDRDRDRESIRSRDHSRDSERSSHSDRDGYRDRERDRERERERRERERDRDRDRDDDRAGEKWVTDTPTNTVLLRGLPVCIEEKDIRAELMLFGAPIKDVRLMRKSSGASRGFAFVEFQSIDDALRWMDTNQKKLILQNQYTCTMNFSTPKDRHDKSIVHKMDWTCSKCGAHNFKRRDHCFGCNLSRYESGKTQADGYDHVGTNPCNTLLFRGLDALTTEENLLRALTNVTQHTCKNVKVIRDASTQMSAGYAFVELSSVAESMNFLDLIKALKPGFEVDGKQILVSFAKNTFSTSIATITASQQQQQQQQAWDQTSTSDYYQGYDYSQTPGYDQTGYYSGQYYDNQTYDYSSYYDTTVTTATAPATTSVVSTTTANISNTHTDATNAAAAVAQAAIQQAQAAKNYQKQVQKQKKIAEMTKEERLAHQAQEWKKKSQDKPEKSEVTKYPPPDVSVYQYDETSGYYYDPVTTLYYDANSQYYYNSNTGQFLYWDSEQSSYLPAPTNYEDSSSTDKTESKDEKKETKEKKEKVKVAKKIAKDMEKWAKSMNAHKEAIKDGMKKINLPNLSGKKESATADAGFAILEKAKNVTGEDKQLMPPPPPVGGGNVTPDLTKSSLVASYGGDSDEEDEEGSPGDKVVDESKLLDFNKMACLLCKRQFQSKDQLTRHAQMSDLHKQNLESLRASQSSNSITAAQQYRDRAKERREKIGSTAPPPRKRPAVPEPFEQPTKAGIGDDNIGSKMLQKMGWSSGQGLGKKSQGIVNPIQAERRSATAGLGMRGSNYNIEDTDNYKDALRKTMFARYQEIE